MLPCGPVDASVLLPGSKYLANRLLPLCALANSASRLCNVVANEDIKAAIAGLSALGYGFEQQGETLLISPRKALLSQPAQVYSAHSGTFSRFVTAIAALEEQSVTIDCSAKMATRPMQELFSALASLGVSIASPNQCLPATVCGPVKGDHCQLDASRSSQYLSALLMIAPFLANGLTIEVGGELVSRAYVDMTIALMKKMGVTVMEENHHFSVKPGQQYRGVDYTIPGDPVSASYFLGATLIAGGQVRVEHFDFDSVQGESEFFRVLELMGAQVARHDNDLILKASGDIHGIEVDMGAMPDAVQTLAAVACYAKGKTRITNIGHLAYKESNRILDTASEIRKTGIRVETGADFMVIEGGQPKAAVIETHDDHRMAMSLALLGIRVEGMEIQNAEVVAKSFPGYWQQMAALGFNSRIVD